MEPWSACAPLCSVRPIVAELLGRLLAEPVTWLRALPGWLVLVTAALVIAAETSLLVGMVLPGASAVLALGLLAHQGTVSPLPAAVTAAVAAVIGAHAGYWVGRYRGLPTGSALRRPTLHAVGLFRRLGPAAVCLGQWTVGVRTLTPRLAGCSGMPYHRFARYSAPTAATWGATLVLLGTLSGDYSGPVLRWLGYGPAGLLALLLALGWWRYRRRGRAGRLVVDGGPEPLGGRLGRFGGLSRRSG
jgi:membrane protein DedA with SNARE-associated domain